MTDSDPRGSGELTDAQLDQLLAETNRELLENVEATSDPTRTLTAIMTRSAQQDRASRAGRRVRSGPRGQALAVVGSRIRARASDVAHTLGAWAGRVKPLTLFYAAGVPVAVAWTVLLVAQHAHADACRQAHATAAACRQLQTPAVLVVSIMVSCIAAIILMVCAVWRECIRRWGRSRLAGEPGQALAAIMSSRTRARAAARFLDDAYRAPHVDKFGNDPRLEHLVYASERARGLADELARSHDRDRADARALRAEIDHAIDLARRRDRALGWIVRNVLDRGSLQLSGGALNDKFAQTIAGARRIAIALARALDEREVDVSGADLSGMDIKPDLLNGAIWTHQTAWPPDVVSYVKAHSTEIRPDVYRVRLGTGAAGLAGAAPSGASPA